MTTNTDAAPAATFAGVGKSDRHPSRHSNTYRLSPVVRVDGGPFSGEVDLEAWVTTQVTMEDYNTPRSNRSVARPDDPDSDDDGIDDGEDGALAVHVTALDLERTLLSQTNAAADSISKRSARTGRNGLADMSDTIEEIQVTLERCSDDVCVTVRENADHRKKLVQQAQSHVENGEWDDAAAAVDEIRDIVEGDIGRLEDYNSPRSNRTIAGPDGVRTDDEADEIIRYLDDAPIVSERFTVCLPDAEGPGRNESLAQEVTPQRFIDYITGRAASDSDGKVYAWGRNQQSATKSNTDCDDGDSSVRPDEVCTPRYFESAISAPVATGGGLESSSESDVSVTVLNTPPQADGGASVLECPLDGEAYEPSDLSEWGSESGGSSETPTVVCQVWVQPPECPYPVPALLYVKRCRSDDQLVYSGGWVLDTAGLYEESVTMLTLAGETQMVPVGLGEFDGDALGELVERSVSGERARRGARVETGSVDTLVESGIMAAGEDIILRKRPGRAMEDGGGTVYCWGSNEYSKDDSSSCGEPGEVVVMYCPLDAPVLHLVDAARASTEAKFKAGAELSKSVN